MVYQKRERMSFCVNFCAQLILRRGRDETGPAIVAGPVFMSHVGSPSWGNACRVLVRRAISCSCSAPGSLSCFYYTPFHDPSLCCRALNPVRDIIKQRRLTLRVGDLAAGPLTRFCADYFQEYQALHYPFADTHQKLLKA